MDEITKSTAELIKDALSDNNLKCFECQQVILSVDGVNIGGKCFHSECLVCHNCARPIKKDEELFFGTNNTFICSDCKSYAILATVKYCYYCKKRIESSAMTALDQSWHTECFTCTDCGTILTGMFRDNNGIPYCEDCWLKNFAKTCQICQRYIAESVMTIEGHHYHVECVKCQVCKKPFDNVFDILNIDIEFWHVDCFKEEDESESEPSRSSSTSSALLGVYNKSLGLSNTPTSTRSRKISIVSVTALHQVPVQSVTPSNGSDAKNTSSIELGPVNQVEANGVTNNVAVESKCCVLL